MPPGKPNDSQNTHHFLPAAQKVKLVPMSAEQFGQQRRKKLALAAGIILGLALVCALVVWWTAAPVNAKTDFEDALLLAESGKHREALNACSRAIGNKANLTEAFQLRARLYKTLSEPENAIQDFDRLIVMRPDNLENYKLRAECLMDLGRFDAALRDYNKLVEAEPSAAAFNGRGVCYRALGDATKALADFQAAVRMDPNMDTLLQRGMALDATGNHREAIADFDRVIDLRGEVPYTYRARASAKEAMGDRAGAAEDRERARQLEYPEYQPSRSAASQGEKLKAASTSSLPREGP